MIANVSRVDRRTVFSAVIAAAGLVLAVPADAAPRGTEMDLTLMPAAGGMEGLGLVRAADPMSMLFGNPATATQLDGKLSFTLGASFISPDLRTKSDGAPAQDGYPGVPPFDGESAFDQSLAPHAGVVQRVTDQLVVGGGITAISGLGSDFRREIPGGLGPVADLKLFGGNLTAGYEVTPRLSVGGAITLGGGSLQMGLSENTASVNAFGLRATVGATYDLGLVAVGGTYRSPMSIKYKDVVETAPGEFSSVRLEQPQEIGLGIATTDALWRDFYVGLDLRWKNYENARTYRAVWRDQYTATLAGQYDQARWSFRGGYTYSTDIQKQNISSGIDGIDTLAIFDPNAGERVAAPIGPAQVQLFQATATNGFWRQSLSLGLGYAFTQGLRGDVSAGYAFDGRTTIGANNVRGNIWNANAGLTWSF
jgi:long-chain fatty acid transport protein